MLEDSLIGRARSSCRGDFHLTALVCCCRPPMHARTCTFFLIINTAAAPEVVVFLVPASPSCPSPSSSSASSSSSRLLPSALHARPSSLFSCSAPPFPALSHTQTHTHTQTQSGAHAHYNTASSSQCSSRTFSPPVLAWLLHPFPPPSVSPPSPRHFCPSG